jgi:hypothetical protein
LFIRCQLHFQYIVDTTTPQRRRYAHTQIVEPIFTIKYRRTTNYLISIVHNGLDNFLHADSRGHAGGTACLQFFVAAARGCNLDFMPLFRERYDLVMSIASYQSQRLSPMLKIIVSDEFKKIVDEVGGYDTSQTGTATFFS